MNLQERMRGLGYLMLGGAVPDETGGGLAPWGLLRIVCGVLLGTVIAVSIAWKLNSALADAAVSRHLAIAFAAVLVYAVVAVVLTIVNRSRSIDRL